MYNYVCISALYNAKSQQVKDKEREIKHKLRPHNAFLRAKDLDLPASHPREELHQLLIGLYGEYA